ncbi:17345_t:CDS:2, partial [Gigaspora rosea]
VNGFWEKKKIWMLELEAENRRLEKTFGEVMGAREFRVMLEGVLASKGESSSFLMMLEDEVGE